MCALYHAFPLSSADENDRERLPNAFESPNAFMFLLDQSVPYRTLPCILISLSGPRKEDPQDHDEDEHEHTDDGFQSTSLRGDGIVSTLGFIFIFGGLV